MNVPQFLPTPKPNEVKKDDKEDYLIFKRSTVIIITILSFIFFGILLILMKFSSITLNGTNVVCQTDSNYPLVKNNIQASHAYTEQVSQLGTIYCVKADDTGLLWGNSMQPTFFEGNTVLTKDYNENVTLHTGDMIRFFRFNKQYPNCKSLQEANTNNSLDGVFINNTMAVIHRVSAIYNNDIVAIGDNLNQIETIQRCQITDVVIGVIFT